MQHGNRLFLLTMLTTLGCPTDPVDAGDDGSTGTTGPGPGGTTDTTSGEDTTALDSSSGSDGDSTTGDASSSGGSTEGTTGDPTTGTTGTTGDPTGSTGDTEGTGDTESTGSTTGDSSPAVEACDAFLDLYYGECNGAFVPDGYCEDLVDYYASYYPDGCVDAQAELWSCLSMLECVDFDVDGFPLDCAKEAAASEEACPPPPGEYCSSGGGGGGPGMCEFIGEDCIDGNTYGVDCAGMTCSCTVNGMEVDTFPYDGSDCFDDEFFGTLDDNCGFPNVFPV